MTTTLPAPQHGTAELRPYDPTEEMCWAAKRIDPALSQLQIRDLWRSMWSAAAHPSPAVQEDALDAACQRACMELPEGMSMAIQLERHAGWIELHDSDGEQIELPNADGSLAEQVHQAIDAARAAQEGK